MGKVRSLSKIIGVFLCLISIVVCMSFVVQSKAYYKIIYQSQNWEEIIGVAYTYSNGKLQKDFLATSKAIEFEGKRISLNNEFGFRNTVVVSKDLSLVATGVPIAINENNRSITYDFKVHDRNGEILWNRQFTTQLILDQAVLIPHQNGTVYLYNSEIGDVVQLNQETEKTILFDFGVEQITPTKDWLVIMGRYGEKLSVMVSDLDGKKKWEKIHQYRDGEGIYGDVGPRFYTDNKYCMLMYPEKSKGIWKNCYLLYRIDDGQLVLKTEVENRSRIQGFITDKYLFISNGRTIKKIDIKTGKVEAARSLKTLISKMFIENDHIIIESYNRENDHSIYFVCIFDTDLKEKQNITLGEISGVPVPENVILLPKDLIFMFWDKIIRVGR
jgi:hypothetical protein